MEGLRAEIWEGMGPVNLLSYRYNSLSRLSVNTSEGMALERLLVYRLKIVREVLKAEIWEGRGPVSLF